MKKFLTLILVLGLCLGTCKVAYADTPTITPTITPTVTPTITPTITQTVTPTATPTVTPRAATRGTRLINHLSDGDKCIVTIHPTYLYSIFQFQGNVGVEGNTLNLWSANSLDEIGLKGNTLDGRYRGRVYFAPFIDSGDYDFGENPSMLFNEGIGIEAEGDDLELLFKYYQIDGQGGR